MDYPSNYNCACGKQASAFVGQKDPDVKHCPKCGRCAEEWWNERVINKEKSDERLIESDH